MLSNIVTFIPQNFDVLAGLQAELCLVKFEKLDACIRPFLQICSYIMYFLMMNNV